VSATVPPGQAEVAAFLEGLAGAPPLQTHISAVFRGADTVWKLKKAVRLDFLDFTRLEDRRRFLERELALNAPYAPGLYRDVVAVRRGPEGLSLGGDGPVLDWVLRMAPVPEDRFLDHVAAAGGMTPALLTALADAVAAMHGRQTATATAPVSGAGDPAGRLRRVADGNARAARAAGIDEGRIVTWHAAVTEALNQAAPLLQARAGLVRRAHGDLHLGNLLLWQGVPTPFDALEFDEALATIDPGYDLAFLLMDLEQRVSRAAANQVLNRYVARTGDAGLVAVLAPFLSLRAFIRAHVEAARGRPCQALLAAAQAALAPARPVVVAIGGLMGTGKSTLARAVAPGLGAAPGALVLRSDETRKRLFGVAPEARLPAHAYGAAANARTEAALLAMLQAAVPTGKAHAVIIDASFLDEAARDRVRSAAQAAGLPFAGFWLEAPLPELERRVAARQGDASDATVAVLRAAAARPPPDDWTRIDATVAAAARDQVQTRLAML